MEITPFLHPSVIITIFLSIVGYVVWQVRLESKISSNTTAISNLQADVKDLWTEFENHRLNQDIHFNLRVSNQVEQGNERRFNHIEKQLSEINHKLDKLSEK